MKSRQSTLAQQQHNSGRCDFLVRQINVKHPIALQRKRTHFTLVTAAIVVEDDFFNEFHAITGEVPGTELELGDGSATAFR